MSATLKVTLKGGEKVDVFTPWDNDAHVQWNEATHGETISSASNSRAMNKIRGSVRGIFTPYEVEGVEGDSVVYPDTRSTSHIEGYDSEGNEVYIDSKEVASVTVLDR